MECVEAKRFLATHNVGYIEKDVVESREYMMELVNQFRVMSVPVLVVDGTPVIGFKESAYREALGL